MKKHRTLEKASKEEDFKLAHSMIADYLEELIEEITRMGGEENGKHSNN